jgi:uncharacterized protein
MIQPDFRLRIEQYIRREASPAYKYSHQSRLYALTQDIATGSTPPLRYDDDVVFAAAYLHDLGVFLGHRPHSPAELEAWDNVAYASRQASSLLVSFDFPSEKVAAVVACISEHLPQTEPHTLEATLLRDADILEQLGAVGILRTAAKLGSDTRFHRLADVQRSLHRALDDLPSQLRLPAAQALAVPRIASLRHFLTELERSTGTGLD